MNPLKNFNELRKSISREEKMIKEINSFFSGFDRGENKERKMVFSQIDSLKNSLRKENQKTSKILERVFLAKPLPQATGVVKDSNPENKKEMDSKNFIEKHFKILNKKEESNKKKWRNPKKDARISNKIFSGLSGYLLSKGKFKKLQTDLIKANMKYLPKIYVSIMFFSTFLALIISIFILTFFLFFNLSSLPPFITRASESILERFLKTLWVLFVIPMGTFVFMYFYPALEKGSLERKINQELPFATINMAAISGSLIDPTKIFSIIILTKEYPALEKEFIKIINSINILGYDLITVLRNNAFNSPSKRLADLFNGLATTINSGGDLPKFFGERAKNMLFEYKLEQEKDTRASETFMDIYISVVIAAPMIFMLLMIMIQISGLGISLSISLITLIMVFGVSIINIFFLTFLHLKQTKD